MSSSFALSQARVNLINFSHHLAEEIDSLGVNSNDAYSYDQPIQEIVQRSIGMINQYHAEEEKSLKAKIEVYQPLLKNLRGLGDQINDSKTVWQRFLSLFIYLSKGEADLHSLIHQLEEIAQQTEIAEKKLWKGEKTILFNRQKIMEGQLSVISVPEELEFFFKWMEWLTPDDFNQQYCDILTALKMTDKNALKLGSGILKESYFRVIGQHKMSSKILEGSINSRSMKSIRDDIKKFKIRFKNQLTTAQLAQLDDIYQNLKDAQKLALEISFDQIRNQWSKEISVFESAAHENNNHELRLADVAYSMQKKMPLLEKNERMIIPGGCHYGDSGHAIIFEVKRENNGTYTFTIVNTGDGVGEFDGLLYNLWHGFITRKFCDYTVKNLSLNQISDLDFLTDLIKPLSSLEQGESIKDSFQPIIDHLLEGHTDRFEHGRQHSIQTNGTCTHDSVMSWIESCTDPLLFESLRLFMTAEGLENIKHARIEKDKNHLEAKLPGMPPLKGEEIVKKVSELGQQVFNDRKDQLTKNLEQSQKNLNKSIQDLKDKRQLALKKVTNLQKKRNPEHFTAYHKVLLLKVEKCKEIYCKISNQMGEAKPKSPGFFDSSQKKNAWAAYEKKLAKLNLLATPNYDKIQQQISVEEKVLEEVNNHLEANKQQAEACQSYRHILNVI